jgi:4-hydroxybenzoate polyprenyltransferase
MTLAGKLFRFFIFSNLFIACCAVLMAHQASGLMPGSAPPPAFLIFIFFATLCSYSFHWYLTPAETGDRTPRLVWLEQNRKIHLFFLVLGFTGAFVTFFFLIVIWKWLLLAALVTFLYSAPKIPHPFFRGLRKLALGKTIFLAFTWTYVTSILPLQIGSETWFREFSLFAGYRFFLIYAICILFDYRDREYDRSIGIRSLITWFSERGISNLFWFSLLVSAGCLFLLLPGVSTFTLFALALPVFLTGLIYNHARSNFSDMLYYFVLDGLMALSSLLTLFVHLKH